jgi:tRNA1Val (adenine37-N6)-methyltransferase
MKVGTDSVLLGAWATVTGRRRILDVGTGTGILSLMLAQRTEGRVPITAIDIHEACCGEAAENSRESPWPMSIGVQNVSLQEFHGSGPFDLIISNPPYFTDSLRPPDPLRGLARHTDALDHEEFLLHCTRLMSGDGLVSVVLPVSASGRFLRSASQHSLFAARILNVKTRRGKVSSRRLIELSLRCEEPDEQELTILEEDGSWSEEYRRLTRDFYLGI